MTIPATPERKPATSPLLVLTLSVVGFSFAAPLIRLSASAPLVIAAWRMAFTLVVVGVALVVTGGWRKWALLGRTEFLLAAAGGVMLALHFWSWNTSLRYTSVAASVSLVNLQPAIIAIISARWLGEQPSGRQWFGIALAMLGALVVGLADVPGGIWNLGAALTASDSNSASRAVLGDVLAVLGAVTAAGYYLIGRRVRKVLDLWPYVGLVYSACLITLMLLAVVTGEALWPQPPREIAIFAGLALGPSLLGHTGMNWALGYLPAYIVNLTVLGEPIGATLLAAIIPGIGEVPGVGVLIGGAIVLAGVYLTAKRATPGGSGK
ncbi:MAG: DMT family transporter [Phycisphaerae bacterium]|nr:DMT family transporter [Gemmatimonadaceae bacterium]